MTDVRPTADAAYVPGQGLPPAVPLGSSTDDVKPQVSARPVEPRGTNIPPTSSSELPGRVSARALAKLEEHLPERDRQVLETVARHRYVTTHQIQRFIFRDHGSEESAARTARRVTRRLSRVGLLRPLERRIGGVRSGSAATIWQLAPAGAKLVRNENANYRTHLPSPRFLRHCLVVADVALAVLSIADGSEIGHASVQPEPECWRRYSGPGGEQRWLQPDLFARLTAESFVDNWFIEVDLGTESLPTLVRKCQQYEAYRQSGLEQHRHGAFPLVLWVFLHENRADELQRRLLRSSSLTATMHRFTGPSQLRTTLLEGAG